MGALILRDGLLLVQLCGEISGITTRIGLGGLFLALWRHYREILLRIIQTGADARSSS